MDSVKDYLKCMYVYIRTRDHINKFGFVGYPGYEWPKSAKQFECCCAEHATSIMIGTKEQLTRYEVLAQKYSGCRDEINKMLVLFL